MLLLLLMLEMVRVMVLKHCFDSSVRALERYYSRADSRSYDSVN